MAKLNLFKYPGAKSYLMKWHLTLLPSNYTELKFVSPFGGAINEILQKRRSVKEVVGERDWTVYCIYLSLKHKTHHFKSLVNVEYSEWNFLKSKRIIDNVEEWTKFLPVELGAHEYIVRNMSRGGLGKDFAWSERLRGGKPGDVNAYENKLKNLDKIVERIQDVEFRNIDFRHTIINEDSPDTIFYLDPPYVHSTRNSKRQYRFEMSDSDHQDLLNRIKLCKGKVLLCGYDNDLYNDALVGWHKSFKDIASHAGQSKKKGRKIEVVWRNYK